jgi:hypothetical protein
VENVASIKIPEWVNLFDPIPPRYIKFLRLIITNARQYTNGIACWTLYQRFTVWNANAVAVPSRRTELCSHVLGGQQNAKLSRQIFAFKQSQVFCFDVCCSFEL